MGGLKQVIGASPISAGAREHHIILVRSRGLMRSRDGELLLRPAINVNFT